MKLSIGDIVMGVGIHNKGVERIITKVRKSGYSWKYLDSDIVYRSENSNDAFFEYGWIKKERD